MKAVGIVACSNALTLDRKEQTQSLIDFLQSTGRRVIVSNCIYERDGPFSGTGKARAAELMKLFGTPDVENVYDISGGDIANEVLDWLDFAQIQASHATFWGYSDLTTVLNAIYSQTGKSSILYQVNHMVYGAYQSLQRQRFLGKTDLFHPYFRFIQGHTMRGIVVGGNIRCFLKLSGTPYFPETTGRLLLLESLGGEVPQMVTYLSQLKSCGALDKVAGILLGTFSKMEKNRCVPNIATLVRSFVGSDIPIAQTDEIGHHANSKAIRIGSMLSLADTER